MRKPLRVWRRISTSSVCHEEQPHRDYTSRGRVQADVRQAYGEEPTFNGSYLD